MRGRSHDRSQSMQLRCFHSYGPKVRMVIAVMLD